MKRPHPVELNPSKRGRRLSIAFAIIAGASSALLSPAPARAAMALEWTAPPECPQEADVRRKLRLLAGETLDQGIDLQVQAGVEKVEGKYRLRLQVSDRGELLERVIVSNSCADLAGAAAVALVLLLQEGEAQGDVQGGEDDPTASAGGGESSPSSVRKGDMGSAPRVSPGPTDSESYPTIWEIPATGRSSGISPFVRFPIAAVDLGPLPGPNVGFGLGAGIRADLWRFVAVGKFTLPRQIESQAQDGVGTQVQRVSAGLSICRAVSGKPVEFSPCFLLGLEHVEARGFGTNVEPRVAQRWWLAPGAEFTLHVQVADWLAPFAAVSGQVEVERPHFWVDGLGDVGRSAPFALGAVLGVDWIF